MTILSQLYDEYQHPAPAVDKAVNAEVLLSLRLPISMIPAEQCTRNQQFDVPSVSYVAETRLQRVRYCSRHAHCPFSTTALYCY